MAIAWNQAGFVTTDGTDISGLAAANNFSFGSTRLLKKLTVLLSDGAVNDNGLLDSFSGTIGWAIYSDNGGKPGTLLFSGTDAAPTLTDTGSQSGLGGDIFQVDLSLNDLALTAGNYWVAIHEGAWGSGDDGSSVQCVRSASTFGAGVSTGSPVTGPTAWTTGGANDSAFALTSSSVWAQDDFTTALGANLTTGMAAASFTLGAKTPLTGASIWITDSVVNDNGVIDAFSGVLAWSIYRNSNGQPGNVEIGSGSLADAIVDTGLQAVNGGDIARLDFSFLQYVTSDFPPGDYFLVLRETGWHGLGDGSPIYWNFNTTVTGPDTFVSSIVGDQVVWAPTGFDTSFQLADPVLIAARDTVAGPTNEDTSVLVDVLANDWISPGSFTISASSTQGTATIDDNGTPGDASDDRILFTPRANFNGTASFKYTLTSGNVTSTASVSVTIRAVNDAPTVTNFDGDATFWNQGNGGVRLDTGAHAAFGDVDFGQLGTIADFGGGQLAIDITGGGVPGEDLIYFATDDRVTIIGADVHVGGVNIGSFIGSGGNRLLGLSNLATQPLLAEALLHLRYVNTGANPTGGTRTITYTLVDGDGTANGGNDTLVWTSTVDVIAFDQTGIANADTRALNEGQKVNIAVLANDSDANGPLAVAEINGTPISTGGSVQLPSGALVWLLPGGKLQYDTNGAFEWLASAATGAATGALSSYIDKFSYTLPDGSSAQVAVTVNGFDGPDGKLSGDAGNNSLTGTAGNDTFLLQGGGVDSASGGMGNDNFYFGATLNTGDTVNGGAGNDSLLLQGNYGRGSGSGAVTLTAGMLTDIEMIVVMSGSNAIYGGEPGTHRYYLKTVDATLAAGKTLTVQGSKLGNFESLNFDGRAETNASFRLVGGSGGDSLSGGALADWIIGGPSSDSMHGGGGADIFFFRDMDLGLATGVGASMDQISDLTAIDRIDLTGIDANWNTVGDDAFTFIGTAAYTGVAGQLRATLLHDGISYEWFIEGDVNGDGTSDFHLLARTPMGWEQPELLPIIL